jgi:hypothetical protein
MIHEPPKMANHAIAKRHPRSRFVALIAEDKREVRVGFTR